MSLADAIDDVLVWAARAIKLIPVIKGLWSAIESSDADKQFAAQMEMSRQIRKMQARAEVDEPPT